MLAELGEDENTFNYITGWPLYFGIVFYYSAACLMHPGPIRANWNLYKAEDPNNNKHCEFCRVVRPYRASHCSRCNVCIVRRDHHCDFTNKCIGYNNMKPFLWFLWFTLLGTLHFFLRLCQWTKHWYYQDLNCVTSFNGWWIYVLLYALIVTYGYFIVFLCRFNYRAWTNVLYNLTFLDHLNGMQQPWPCAEFKDPINVFHFGIVRNFTEVFGANPLFWLSPYPPSSWGVSYGPEFVSFRPLYLSEVKGAAKLPAIPPTLRYQMILMKKQSEQTKAQYEVLINRLKA